MSTPIRGVTSVPASAEAGTPVVAHGVSVPTTRSPAVPVRRVRSLGLAALLLGALSLLGQGEDCRVDTRFISPSATLTTFWEALRTGDAEGVWECFVEGRHDLPMPGMLWFLPSTEKIELAEFRSLPVTAGRVLVTYDVRFVPRGSDEEHSFRTGDELVRMRGEWRIAQPIGQVSMPEFRLPPAPVDI